MFPFASVDATKSKSASRAIGESLISRAPALRESADRITASIVKSLQTMAGPATTVDGMVAALAMEPARDIVTAHRSDSAAGLIECPDIDLALLATFDATLVHSLVELLCGGNGTEPKAPHARPITAIDRQFAHILFNFVAAAIKTDWEALGFGTTRAIKLDSVPQDVFGRASDIGVISLTIGIFGLHGTLRIALPPQALERFAPSKSEATAMASAGPDLAWTNILQNSLGRAPVKLEAYLEASEHTLGALEDLKVGHILRLPSGTCSRAVLISNGNRLYRGAIGQDDHRYTLRIDDILTDPARIAASSDAPPSLKPIFELSEV
jgi:flagellar motor switch protein FliM